MKPGRVLAVVGPSGVGKDSVMAGMAAVSDLTIVQRVITRAPGLGGEDYVPMTVAEFEKAVDDRAFCLHWPAHGLFYGIPAHVAERARAGQSFLVNLSRRVLAQAHEVFPSFQVINLTARPETLAARLADRGRESVEDIRARLARTVSAFPDGVVVTDISNDGPLEQTLSTALRAIQLVRA